MTPETKPLPIEPCPNPECPSGEIGFCTDEDLGTCFYGCDCGYHGPEVHCIWQSGQKFEKAKAEALRLHNLICRPHSGQTPAGVREAAQRLVEELWPTPPAHQAEKFNALVASTRATYLPTIEKYLEALLSGMAWRPGEAEAIELLTWLRDEIFSGHWHAHGGPWGCERCDAYQKIDLFIRQHPTAVPVTTGWRPIEGQLSATVYNIRCLVKWHTNNGTMHPDCASDFEELLATFPKDFGAPLPPPPSEPTGGAK